MHWFFLSAAILAVGALLCAWAGRRGKEADSPPATSEETESFRRWMEAAEEELERAVEALGEVMDHPSLGGPGFLTVRLPPAGEEGVLGVTAQYPNIGETMYRCAERGDGRMLAAVGAPEALLALRPVLAAESGGVVEIFLEAGRLPRPLSDRREWQAALEVLEERLASRFPEMSVRRFGAELMLTPVRRGEAW